MRSFPKALMFEFDNALRGAETNTQTLQGIFRFGLYGNLGFRWLFCIKSRKINNDLII